MRIRVGLVIGPSEDIQDLRTIIRTASKVRNDLSFIHWGGLFYHCRRAETPEEKDQQAKKIQKELGSYLKGGTRKVAGITGKETIESILKRIKTFRISGEDKLIQRLGKHRYDQLLKGSKVDLIKGYLSLAKARGITVSKSDLKKIPEALRKQADITVSESNLIRREKGYSRWEESNGRRVWRDENGHYSKGPRSK